jgi:hypothetical protein
MRNVASWPLALLALNLLSAAPVFAVDTVAPVEPAEMVTDRPDFTEATETVAPGQFQLESGFEWSSHSLDAGVSRSTGWPFPLLRIGLTRRLELRLGSDGYQTEAVESQGAVEHESGLADLEIAAKLRLWDERKWRPAFSVISGVSLPLGSRAFSSQSLDPFVKLCLSKTLGAGFDAGFNWNYQWDTDGPMRNVGTSASFTTGHKLGAGFRGFAEVYRTAPGWAEESSAVVFDAGVSHFLGKDMQFDFSAGRTILDRTPVWLVGAGFSIRGSLRSLFHLQ